MSQDTVCTFSRRLKGKRYNQGVSLTPPKLLLLSPSAVLSPGCVQGPQVFQKVPMWRAQVPVCLKLTNKCLILAQVTWDQRNGHCSLRSKGTAELSGFLWAQHRCSINAVTATISLVLCLWRQRPSMGPERPCLLTWGQQGTRGPPHFPLSRAHPPSS